MRASVTRLLLLGAVRLFEPVNGYQIRRELLSWQVDQWASIRPGSIYHGLASLTSDGLLRRHDLTDGTRDVAVYESTDAGRAELHRLLEWSITTVNSFDRRDFHAGFGLVALLDRATGVDLLGRRLTALEAAVAEFDRGSGATDPYVPPHALRGVDLWAAEARAELRWLIELLDDIESGELAMFTDDQPDWVPAPDDPGHQMSADRERYRALLR
ncbi:PadR family transcriptional regulator [Gordonia soli]|uniref:Putative PadR family transcriptional regulator n=1 Tax=Gordonia soli NBRC 108243 TaxID=1223545 RepID=M0QJI3_9ACTN|nr:PadR family transcriptional regulator [Gordonia soli]GAC68614.1 putative PadR family transcriptional regulator [Gordonia soli NBRC 108243]